ncbi:hypothetical protein P280DRAFT_480549 [Massarina eburnea CBS 473.64]|uniref:Hemerythrin-like domain-containing protein n=1 Tax=Massarina eburnea CBS 473.64 TaxID=1395130 RepID=A0A6A6S045_9PLEO|nr:hypothetical protein P280DRAFT_480549 [Massarina eburnea CBS 473.64]
MPSQWADQPYSLISTTSFSQNVKGLMQRNVEQHQAFTPGLEKFHEYTKTCAPKNYDSGKIRELVEGFAEPLTRHLHDEIETLRALNQCDNGRVMQAYATLEKLTGDTDDVR